MKTHRKFEVFGQFQQILCQARENAGPLTVAPLLLKASAVCVVRRCAFGVGLRSEKCFHSPTEVKCNGVDDEDANFRMVFEEKREGLREV
jgi:hypothetical protein